MVRAALAQEVTARASTIEATPGRSTAASAVVKGNWGRTRNHSVTRPRAVADRPLKCPASTPTTVAIAIVAAVADNAMSKVSRVLRRVSARIDTPFSSVPNG
jgi:hypothetical protein